jgi:transcriptional repressor NrdR
MFNEEVGGNADMWPPRRGRDPKMLIAFRQTLTFPQRKVAEMVDVTKRDGRREPFVPEKIVVSAMKAGAPPDNARSIAQNIERDMQEGMKTDEIRRRVLEQLRAENPSWEQHWLMYDESVKKRAPEIARPVMR